MALFIQFIAAYIALFYASTVFSFLFGSFLLFITIIQDISNDLNHLTYNEKLGENDRNLRIHFYNIVQLYLDVKQLS